VPSGENAGQQLFHHTLLPDDHLAQLGGDLAPSGVNLFDIQG
jgi:hypothetical protein